MRLPRPRLSLRTLMILVPLAALVMAYAYRVETARRRTAYLWIAIDHGRQRSRIREMVDNSGRVVGWTRYDPARGVWSRTSRAEREYEAGMEQKYRHAADHPWLPLPPDPFAPDPRSRGPR